MRGLKVGCPVAYVGMEKMSSGLVWKVNGKNGFVVDWDNESGRS
jgi:hypothetical protein